MAVESLPPLREVIAAHGLSAQKRFGQHFLFDLNLTRKIARAADVQNAATVVEIGPGPGGLTRALLLEGAPNVIAVERDPRFADALADLSAASGERLRVVAGDALAVDLAAFGPAPRQVVANLPYNISTPILVALFRQATAWHSLTLMFQKEVADRLNARPGTAAYGRLSVLAQALCRVEKLFDIPASAFVPPPKVVSTVVRLLPKPDAGSVDLPALERLTAAAFGQRRKMLRSSLKPLFPDLESALAAVGLSPEQRAEVVPPDVFVQLSRAL